MTENEPTLAVEGLTVTARRSDGAYPAVRDVGFRLGRASTLALVGESGSGKTLTALAIAGLLADNLTPSGSARFRGEQLIGMPPARRRALAGSSIGFIFQEPMSALHPVLPIGVQLTEGLRAHTDLSRVQRRERARELLELVGLTQSRDILGNRIGQLSGGMRQRVMIAMAISCEPELLIADEPTTALDVTLQKQVLDLLRGLQQRLGLSLMMITHDLGVVAETCESLAVMYAGEIVESGRTAEVMADPAHPYTTALLEASPRLGDTRRRLPSITSTAPWLRDLREVDPGKWPRTTMRQIGPDRWIRETVEEVAA
ncbi:ABC transporter ATP-binding protein [Leifsonia shinshuensis]|uniref:ABC transporter ATP-binding protein n=1 Tax=Leifsonia shinshuensis TaxID=150026 RepID=UPI002860026E|nr:ABC transporter ATP-binding protein [Leifsonia shinshuensis]MDR6972874.1 ABC-type dipeptide/oligopeptide/nickel transport system ATPase component [Leifsonia shinshuensis]